jgi:signal peptidase II
VACPASSAAAARSPTEIFKDSMARSRSSFGESSRGPSIWLWLAIAAAVVVLDQLSKQFIVSELQLGENRTVTSFFSLVYWHNPGAAFSFLAGAAGWQRWFFIGLALAASAFILRLMVRHAEQKLFCFSVAMVLGGAIGNVVDRIWRGQVVDFILVHWNTWNFPAFNLADSAITLGAICLIVDELMRVRRG